MTFLLREERSFSLFLLCLFVSLFFCSTISGSNNCPSSIIDHHQFCDRLSNHLGIKAFLKCIHSRKRRFLNQVDQLKCVDLHAAIQKINQKNPYDTKSKRLNVVLPHELNKMNPLLWLHLDIGNGLCEHVYSNPQFSHVAQAELQTGL